jgi:hypothetical protein
MTGWIFIPVLKRAPRGCGQGENEMRRSKFWKKKATEMVELEFDRIVKRTENGGVLIDFGDKQVWFPESALDLKDWSAVVGIPEKMAIEKGLI